MTTGHPDTREGAPSPDADGPHLVLGWMRDVVGSPHGAVGRRGDYAVLPSSRAPRLLVPLSSRRAAAEVIRRSGVGRKTSDRTVRRVATIAARAGILQPLLRARLVRDDEHSLMRYLRQELGDGVADIGLRAGNWRSNAKPVVQIIGRDGRLLAFAKLGPTRLTAELVRAESAALQSFASRRFDRLLVPSVLHHGRWGETEVLVQSPLAVTTRRPPGRLVEHAVGEFSAAHGVTRDTLATSSYKRELMARVRELTGAQAQALGLALEGVVRDHGSVVLAFGLGHGDFSPWNTGLAGQQLAVWDWERSRTNVPVGLDLLHYQTRISSGWLDDIDASTQAAAQKLRGWARRDSYITEATVEPITRLYLIELVLRGLEDGPQSDTDQSRRLRRVALAHLAGRAAQPIPD